jgi:hypothetical protein
VFFVLHKREHFTLIPERYFSLLNWSADELDEKHAVVYLAKQRARYASNKLVAKKIQGGRDNIVDAELSTSEGTSPPPLRPLSANEGDLNLTWESLVASAQN